MKVVFAILVVLSSLVSNPVCSCRKASDDEVPHGANQTVEYSGRTVKSLAGKVSYEHDDRPVADVVVEVYELKDFDLDNYHSVDAKSRKAACVTGDDGAFCFPDLPSGKYMLHAGTRNPLGGMNEMYMRITVDRRWPFRWLRRTRIINLRLIPGT